MIYETPPRYLYEVFIKMAKMVLMDLFTPKYATDHFQLLTDVPDVQLPEKNHADKQLLIPY